MQEPLQTTRNLTLGQTQTTANQLDGYQAYRQGREEGRTNGSYKIIQQQEQQQQ